MRKTKRSLEYNSILGDFCSNLNQIIDDRGILKKDLATMLDVSPQCLSSYCAGRTVPDVIMVAKIIVALRVDPIDLIPIRSVVRKPIIKPIEGQMSIYETTMAEGS